MEKTHMHGAKQSQNLIVELSNAHSQVAKSLTKQNSFKMHHLAIKIKFIATLHTLLASHKPASMECGIHSSPT